MNTLLIMGIDPGYGRCGWGVIEVLGNRLRHVDCGVIETLAKVAFPQRLLTLHRSIAQVLDKFQPREVGVEELFFSKNIKTGIDVGQARGVAVLTCAQAEVPVAEYKPVEIKQAVTGYGAATKIQVQKMVMTLLNLKTLSVKDDAVDALAVAICHAHSRRLSDALARGGGV
jgi:crossover junction endodeoxyribonuclease RuvC